MLTRRDIDELRAILTCVYGDVPTVGETWAIAKRLISLFDVLTRPPGTPKLEIECELPGPLTEQEDRGGPSPVDELSVAPA